MEVGMNWTRNSDRESLRVYGEELVSIMRWAGHVAEWGRRGVHIGYWWESRKERYH
jgi:hypothetical protein